MFELFPSPEPPKTPCCSKRSIMPGRNGLPSLSGAVFCAQGVFCEKVVCADYLPTSAQPDVYSPNICDIGLHASIGAE